ncbi:MAG: Smr/MutS family protein [Acidobacteriota bacterium]
MTFASRGTREALEFASLLAVVAHEASTDLGFERVSQLTPFLDREGFERHRLSFEEARRLLAARSLVASREQPLGPVLRALDGSGHQLTGRDLVEVGALLRSSIEATERIRKAEPPCPQLRESVEDLPDATFLRRLLERTFDHRGEIREDATPRLAELRSRIRSVRQRIYDQLGGLVETHREHLSEDTVPMRGGRLVLMLQAGARGRVSGLVHGRSGSGRSFYFEPLEAVEGNNQLQQAVEDEEAEKRRILAEVLERLRRDLPAVMAHADLVADLDLLQAAVRFADASGGRLAELGPRHELRLLGARHPLLDPALASRREVALGKAGHTDPIIPLDLELSPDRRALVVTGPNAGGKTVTLKTLGLLALAHQCGLPVPADKGTRLPFLDGLVATVGDDQDLLADRSTFSGRLLRLREAWEAAGPDALLLLDELGSGTDPEEGAALSVALLEALVARKSLVLVTTHLSQVAASALDTDGAFCAAMQFDTSTGRPTYRMVAGPPGGSEALALAHRLGLPTLWLERAEELLGSDHRDLRKLLAEVEHLRQELEADRGRIRQERLDAERLRERLTRDQAKLVEERRSVAKTLKAELEHFKRKTLDSMRSEVERLRGEMERGRRKGLAAEATVRLFESAPKLEPEPSEPETPLVEGRPVRHRRLGWQGTLEKLDRGRAQVKVGGKLLLCKEKELAGVAPGARSQGSRAAEGSRSPRSKGRGARSLADSPPSLSSQELMLIGRRVEPALGDLDRFLDRALLASAASVRIVHGHGSGSLRRAIRDHLQHHPAVAAVRAGGENEGGDGATVVTLAG